LSPPERSIDKLVGAVASQQLASMLHCFGALWSSDHIRRPPTPCHIRRSCSNIENFNPSLSHLEQQQVREQALFS
jgi:hypothetical protein